MIEKEVQSLKNIGNFHKPAIKDASKYIAYSGMLYKTGKQLQGAEAVYGTLQDAIDLLYRKYKKSISRTAIYFYEVEDPYNCMTSTSYDGLIYVETCTIKQLIHQLRL